MCIFTHTCMPGIRMQCIGKHIFPAVLHLSSFGHSCNFFVDLSSKIVEIESSNIDYMRLEHILSHT